MGRCRDGSRPARPLGGALRMEVKRTNLVPPVDESLEMDLEKGRSEEMSPRPDRKRRPRRPREGISDVAFIMGIPEEELTPRVREALSIIVNAFDRERDGDRIPARAGGALAGTGGRARLPSGVEPTRTHAGNDPSPGAGRTVRDPEPFPPHPRRQRRRHARRSRIGTGRSRPRSGGGKSFRKRDERATSSAASTVAISASF